MKGRRAAIAVALVGVAMVIFAWSKDADWESVFIEIGASLALVVAILWVEERWKSAVSDRIERVEQTVAEAIGPDQVNASIEAFLAKPTTRRLWAIATQLQMLELDKDVEVVLPGTGAIGFRPRSRTETDLAVGARGGPLSSGGRMSIRWTDDMPLGEVFADVREALRQNGFTDDAEYLDQGSVFDLAAQKYRQRIERHFEPD